MTKLKIILRYIIDNIKNKKPFFIRLLSVFFAFIYSIYILIPKAYADSDTESETDGSEQQEQQLERLDVTPHASSDFHQSMAEKKYVGFNCSVEKSLDNKSLSADLYMEWTGAEETDTIELSTFVTRQLGDASTKQQAENNLEKILDTNNRITKELLDRNFYDHKDKYVSEMDEPKLISMPSREPDTIQRNLHSITSEYSEEESKILQHHVKTEKLILDTSKPILNSFDKDLDEKN